MNFYQSPSLQHHYLWPTNYLSEGIWVSPFTFIGDIQLKHNFLGF